MVDLSSSFAGVKIRNPLIVSSSSLTGTISGLRKAADNGAGAVVLKSLFEEQIATGIDRQSADLDPNAHSEALDYLQEMGMHVGGNEYLDLLAEAKKTVDIPIFASVNCVDLNWWSEFAGQFQSVGADGLELNIGLMPHSPTESAAVIEERIYAIVELVRKQTTLPLVVKLGSAFTNVASVCAGLVRRGVKGVVLFNRFYQLDINLDSLQLQPGVVFSNPQDYYASLRWISLLHCELDVDFAAATGIHDAPAALRCILAGAPAVQICSTVYKNGYGVIRRMLEEMEGWMKSKNYSSIGDFRGLLCQKESEKPAEYERLQYIKALTGIY